MIQAVLGYYNKELNQFIEEPGDSDAYLNQDVRSNRELHLREYIGLSLAFRTNEQVDITLDGNHLKRIEDDRSNDVYYISELTYNASGSCVFDIVINQEQFQVYLRIAPVIDPEQYAILCNDIKNILCGLLLFKHKGRIKERVPGRSMELQRLKSRIDSMQMIVDRLYDDPQSDMISEPARMAANKIKRIDETYIIDHYILQRPKVRTRIHSRTFNIYENMQIKKYLCSLLEEMKLLKESYSNKRTSGLDEKEEYILLNEEREFGSLEMKLRKLLDSRIFREIQVSEEELHTTNLFVNHPVYQEAYRNIKGNTDMERILSMPYQYESVKCSSEIYELWCYLKIMKMLVDEGCDIEAMQKPNEKLYTANENPFEPYHVDKLIEPIITKFENKTACNLYNLMLKMKKGEAYIYLGYNYVFEYQDQMNIDHMDETNQKKARKVRRPDILMIIQEGQKCRIYTFDAKYKDFRDSGQGLKEWDNQMINCAARKYIFDMKYRDELLFNERVLEEAAGTDYVYREDKVEICGCCLLHPGLYDEMDRGICDNAHIWIKDEETIGAIYHRQLSEEGDHNRTISDSLSLYPPEFVSGILDDSYDNEYSGKIGSTCFMPKSYRNIGRFLHGIMKQIDS